MAGLADLRDDLRSLVHGRGHLARERVPVGPLAEEPQVRGEDHVASLGEAMPVVAVVLGDRGAALLVVKAADFRLAGTVPVDGEHRRTRVSPRVGHQEKGGNRHGGLAVKDQRMAGVPAGVDRVSLLDVERYRVGVGAEQLREPGAYPFAPRGYRGRVVEGARVGGASGLEAHHPLCPGGEVPVAAHGSRRSAQRRPPAR